MSFSQISVGTNAGAIVKKNVAINPSLIKPNTAAKKTPVIVPKTVVDPNKIAANNASRTKSLGWIKSSVNRTNELLANSSQSKTSKFLSGNNASAEIQGSRLLKSYSYDGELDNSTTEKFALVPNNILDFAEINKSIKDKKSKNRSKDLNTITNFFKKKKIKLRKGWANYIDLSTGYTSNFSESLRSIERFNDTPVSMGFNNITTSMIPVKVGLGFLSPQRRYSYGIAFTYFLTNNVAFARQFPDTLTFSKEHYIYSAAFKPKITLTMLSGEMTYYFHQYMVSGRDLFKLYATLGVDMYYLSYSDKLRITTSNIVLAAVEGENKQYLTEPLNYYQDFERTFAPTYILGGQMGLGATARITRDLTTFIDFKYHFAIPLKEEIKATSMKNVDSKSTSDIPWVAAPNKIRLDYGHLFSLQAGVRFVY